MTTFKPPPTTRVATRTITALAGLMAACTALLAACAAPKPDAIEAVESFGDGGRGAPEEPLAFGVVATDYTATSVALLTPRGELLAGDFVNSGSATTGLVTALSGDVVLPTRSGDPNTLTIIDRFRTDVVTRIDPESGDVLGQVKTHTPDNGDDTPNYSSNPQDYVQLDARNAWVSRFEPNLDTGDDGQDGGNDLLHIDPKNFERGERISMWHLNAQASREDPNTGDTQEITVYARPSAVVRLGSRLVVGLGRLSSGYDAAGPGMVALVDPADGTVEALELPGLQNCASVEPIPDDETHVAVACEGFYRGDLRETAGLAILALEGDALAVKHLWRGTDDPDAPLAVTGLVAISDEVVVAAATPETEDGTDAAYAVNVATGEWQALFETDDRYVIGKGAFNSHQNILLVPDASADDDGRPTAGVRRFERTPDGDFEALDVIAIHDLLPARQVRPL